MCRQRRDWWWVVQTGRGWAAPDLRHPKRKTCACNKLYGLTIFSTIYGLLAQVTRNTEAMPIK